MVFRKCDWPLAGMLLDTLKISTPHLANSDTLHPKSSSLQIWLQSFGGSASLPPLHYKAFEKLGPLKPVHSAEYAMYPRAGPGHSPIPVAGIAGNAVVQVPVGQRLLLVENKLLQLHLHLGACYSTWEEYQSEEEASMWSRECQGTRRVGVGVGGQGNLPLQSSPKARKL